MSACDCGTTPFGRHSRECRQVELNKRPRVDCEHCGEDGQPQAKGTWFRDHDYCAHCEDNYEPPEDDGECFRGGEAAAFEAAQADSWQRRLK